MERADREELIELRNKDKDPVKYDDSILTNSMRKNLFFYNDSINQSKVTISLTGDTPVNLSNLCKKILVSALCGDITITNLTVNQSRVTNLSHPHLQTSYSNNTTLSIQPYNVSMTHNFFIAHAIINSPPKTIFGGTTII